MQTSGQSNLLLDRCKGLRQPETSSIAGAAVVSLLPAG